ncbi:hypothetical protein ASG63_21875 [Methylobacterium sp. Leaf94]|nr:hypothetical protein ASG63_21875 [Methylobacterium sp. Leaf94]
MESNAACKYVTQGSRGLGNVATRQSGQCVLRGWQTEFPCKVIGTAARFPSLLAKDNYLLPFSDEFAKQGNNEVLT